MSKGKQDFGITDEQNYRPYFVEENVVHTVNQLLLENYGFDLHSHSNMQLTFAPVHIWITTNSTYMKSSYDDLRNRYYFDTT